MERFLPRVIVHVRSSQDLTLGEACSREIRAHAEEGLHKRGLCSCFICPLGQSQTYSCGRNQMQLRFLSRFPVTRSPVHYSLNQAITQKAREDRTSVIRQHITALDLPDSSLVLKKKKPVLNQASQLSIAIRRHISSKRSISSKFALSMAFTASQMTEVERAR
jgi:hypothetical protein